MSRLSGKANELFRVGVTLPMVALGLMTASASARGQGVNAGDSRRTIDVSVTDKSGRPVAGLGQQAFTLLVNQQPQPILGFGELTAARTTPGKLEVVIVADEVNADFRTVAFERDEIQKFLQRDAGRLTIPTSIAFFSDAGLTTPTPVTEDGNALMEALNSNKNGLRVSNRSQGFYGAEDRAGLSFRALRELAAYEQGRPGRKVVIWISPGWAMLSGPNVQLSHRNQQDIFNTVVAISSELERARVSIDSVDPLGTADAGSFRTFFYEDFLKPVSKPHDAQFGDLALQVFASHSGGFVQNSSNSVSGEIETCFRRAASSYVLSFEAPPADGANVFQPVEVKVEGNDLKVQTIPGYYVNTTADANANRNPTVTSRR